MNKRLLLVLNPCAGQKRANRFLPEIIRLYNAREYECVVYVTAHPGDATEQLSLHAREFDRVVCVGGDGTLNETIAGLIAGEADCTVGYIPAGTTNDYAASLGLSTDIMKAAVDAVDGTVYQFDIGSFNGRHFIYTASCGAFTRASYTTTQAAKNLLGHLAYILEGIKDIPSLRPVHLHVVCDECELEDDFLFCSITNSLSVGGILKLDPAMVGLNDGVFEVILIKNPMTPAQLTRILFSLSNRELPSDMIYFFTADYLTIDSDGDIEWTLDGERGECGRHFEVRNLHRRMKLALPMAAAERVPAEES